MLLNRQRMQMWSTIFFISWFLFFCGLLSAPKYNNSSPTCQQIVFLELESLVIFILSRFAPFLTTLIRPLEPFSLKVTRICCFTRAPSTRYRLLSGNILLILLPSLCCILKLCCDDFFFCLLYLMMRWANLTIVLYLFFFANHKNSYAHA